MPDNPRAAARDDACHTEMLRGGDATAFGPGPAARAGIWLPSRYCPCTRVAIGRAAGSICDTPESALNPNQRIGHPHCSTRRAALEGCPTHHNGRACPMNCLPSPVCEGLLDTGHRHFNESDASNQNSPHSDEVE